MTLLNLVDFLTKVVRKLWLINCHFYAQLRHISEEKGWGVLAGEPVAAGAFIVQYTGEVVTREVGHSMLMLLVLWEIAIAR